jgi:hypothetical protein
MSSPVPKGVMMGVVRAWESFNTGLALWLTRLIGSMECAYVFALVACLSLPQALESLRHGDMLVAVAWFSQSLCQLVLLPVLLVGERVILERQDAESRREREESREEARQHYEMIGLLVAVLVRHGIVTLATDGAEQNGQLIRIASRVKSDDAA